MKPKPCFLWPLNLKRKLFYYFQSDLTDPIVNKIREELKIDEPGKGIIFVLDVNKTYGLFNTK